MDKSYLLVDNATGEIIQEYRYEKDIAADIRDVILPEHPQWLAEKTVHIVMGQDATRYTLYEFAVQTRLIKGKVKAKK